MKSIFIIVVLTILYLIGMIQIENYRTILQIDVNTNSSSESLVSTHQSQSEIEVLIWGQVVNSKTIKIVSGTRLIDAIQLVGGFTDSADLSAINENYILKAGDVLYVPTRSTTVKISLNNADIPSLDKLPGVGVVLAQRIVNYRTEVGSFNALEEIKNVEGIGEVIFNQIKDLICL